MINATNVERLDTGPMNVEKKEPEMLKDVKRNAINAEKVDTSRKTALISERDPEEDLHLAPAPDQAAPIPKIEEEEEVHPVVPDPRVVIDLTPEERIRRTTRERATRSTEALTRREVEAQAKEARVTAAPRKEKIMKRMETRVEVEVEASKVGD